MPEVWRVSSPRDRSGRQVSPWLDEQHGGRPTGEAFPRTKWTQGYARDDVDAFMATISTRTVEEIEKVQFTVVRLSSGYRMDAVDAALDEWVAKRKPPTT